MLTHKARMNKSGPVRIYTGTRDGVMSYVMGQKRQTKRDTKEETERRAREKLTVTTAYIVSSCSNPDKKMVCSAP